MILSAKYRSFSTCLALCLLVCGCLSAPPKFTGATSDVDATPAPQADTMQRPSSDLGLDGDTSRPLRDATPGPLQRDALIADARLPDDSTLRDEGLKTDMEELDRGRFDAAPVIDAAPVVDAAPVIDAEPIIDAAPVVDAEPDEGLAPVERLVRISATARSPLRGNAAGGESNRFECPRGEVLIGVRGELALGATYLGRLKASCGQIIIEGDEVRTQRGRASELYGRIGGGDAFNATCPDGQSVVVHSGRFGAVVDQLRLGCAPVLIDGIDAQPGEASFIDPVGGEGGVAYGDTRCPDGQFAIGAIVRAGDFVDAFGLLCAGMGVAP